METDPSNPFALELKITRWNGRQIRNAFQTAIALADYDATEIMHNRFERSDTKDLPPARPRVTVDHFRKVANAASDFDRYLKDIFGRDESERAAHDNLRNRDDWGQQANPLIRPAMRGTNNSQGYHQQAQYRQQRIQGRGPYYPGTSFDDVDPFQESKHPVLPNEVNTFKHPSPDPQTLNRSDREGYGEFASPTGRIGSSTTESSWNSSGGPGHAGRMQPMQDGRPRTISAQLFEESGYKTEVTNRFDEFDEGELKDRRRQGQEGQGRLSAY